MAAVGALISANAPSLAVLVLGCAIQGFAGALAPLALGLVRESIPNEHVPLGVGLVTASLVAGGGLSFLVAGYVVDRASRGGGFYLKVGLAVIAMILTWRLIGRTVPARP